MTFEMRLDVPDIVLFDTKKSETLINKESRIAMDSILINLQFEIVSLTPVGVSGDLRSSIQTEVKELPDKLIGVVFAGKKYALAVDQGRKAAPVSELGQASLSRWIDKSAKGREFFSALKGSYPKITLAQATFLLARSLKKKAREGQEFFEEGIENARPKVDSEFNQLGVNLKQGLLKKA